jgi:hypothetical protein
MKAQPGWGQQNPGSPFGKTAPHFASLYAGNAFGPERSNERRILTAMQKPLMWRKVATQLRAIVGPSFVIFRLPSTEYVERESYWVARDVDIPSR